MTTIDEILRQEDQSANVGVRQLRNRGDVIAFTSNRDGNDERPRIRASHNT